MLSNVAEQATGWIGSGDYADYAEAHGFPYVEVYDWTATSGDWTFIVSKDEKVWYVMWQTNNYPSGPGFTRTIDTDHAIEGTSDQVLAFLNDIDSPDCLPPIIVLEDE